MRKAPLVAILALLALLVTASLAAAPPNSLRIVEEAVVDFVAPPPPPPPPALVVDAAQSSVEASASSLEPGQSVDITVTLRTADGTLVPDRTVVLEASSASASIAPAQDVSDAAGEAQFTATDSAAGSVTFTAYVLEDDVEIPPPPPPGGETVLNPGDPWDAAYDAASCGDVIQLASGTWPAQSVSGPKNCPGNPVVIEEAPGATAVVNGLVQTNGASNLTLRRIETAVQVDGNRPGIYVLAASANIRVEDATQGGFLIQGGQNIAFVGGSSGPCRVHTSVNCELNKVDWSQTGTPRQPTDILVDGLDVHDFAYQPSCEVSQDCHHRAMYVNGVNGFTLRNSTFRASVFAPWFTISGPDAGSTGNSNILVENNQFGVQSDGDGSPWSEGAGFQVAWCSNAAQPSYRNVTIRHNSFSRGAEFHPPGTEGFESCRVEDFRIHGNVFGARPGGQGCGTSETGLQYAHNVYAGQRWQFTCGGPGEIWIGGATMPFYTDDDQTPEPGDYDLDEDFAGVNRVPAALCPATDASRAPRDLADGFCDAGAYEGG